MVLMVPGTEGGRFWGQSGEEEDSRVEGQWNGQDAIFSHGDRRQQTGDSWFGASCTRRRGMGCNLTSKSSLLCLARHCRGASQTAWAGTRADWCPKRRSVPQARTAYAWVPVRRVQTPCVVADTNGHNKGDTTHV